MPTLRSAAVDLTRCDCLAALDSVRTGRVSVVANGRGEIVEVQHRYDPQLGRIVFPVDVTTARTCWYTWPWASFEADGRDPDGTSWVVLVTGELLELEYRDDIERLSAAWPGGPMPDETTRWMSLSTDQVTGRRSAALRTDPLHTDGRAS